jgi:uroporphyrinogen decarboxylase
MTSKERVRAAFARQEPDRVPINYSSNAALDRKLKAHFGLDEKDAPGLLTALGVDFRGVGAAYKGPKLHAAAPGVLVDDWGIHRRWVEHETGGYWDYCDFPLRDATLEQIQAWPMPNPDHFDYASIRKACEANRDYAVVLGGAGVGDIINATGMIRTMEQVLLDLMTDDPAGLCYIDRRLAIQLEVYGRSLEAAQGGVDVMWLGEDLGTQTSPMISLDLFRKHIRPRLQKLVDMAKSFNLPVAVHSCGSSSWAYDDFIEMGVNVVDTLQPEAADMAPAYLKKRFGDRLAFHGCISTAGPVATGTVQQTVDNVRETLAVMMPGGGYALAPTHALQDNSPVENVLAMYEAAHKYGWYD